MNNTKTGTKAVSAQSIRFMQLYSFVVLIYGAHLTNQHFGQEIASIVVMFAVSLYFMVMAVIGTITNLILTLHILNKENKEEKC
jgi:hypothetical protein